MKVWTHSKFWALAVVVVFAVPCSLHAQSQPLPAKPGLWEIQASVATVMALPPEVEARIAAMPAAQQAQMRAMMGASMGGHGAPPATVTRQVCLAPQTSMDDLLNQQQSAGMKCTFTNRVQTANGASFDLSCIGPAGSAKGHAEYHMPDDEHVSSSTHMTIVGTAQGHTVNSTADATTSGKLVKADCGDVKPVGTPAQP